MSFTRWLRNLRATFGLSGMRCTVRRQPSRRASSHRPQLEVLEDRRVLSFSPAALYPVGDFPQTIGTGYFNNDTVLDLAVANTSSSNVSVLLGSVDGTFRNAVNYDTGAYPRSVAVGDFNEDGTLDLATANAGDVSVLLGTGDGTFQPAVNLSVSSEPASVAVGDFNADGNLDLVATSNVLTPGSWDYYGYSPGYATGYANVLLGTGTGTFAAPVSSYLGYGMHTSAAVEDFNGDGKDDFVTLNLEQGTARVLLGTATGLGSPGSFATGWYPRAVTVGDLDRKSVV